VRALLLATLLSVTPAASGEPGFEVAGAVEVSGDSLEVRLDLTNRSAVAIDELIVQGELLGRTDDARHDDPTPPGEASRVWLRFPLEVSNPGTHALTLGLEYRLADAARTTLRQRAYLLLTLGAAAAPVVALAVADARLEASADIVATLHSTDGKPHPVKLRLLAPRGLNPTQDSVTLDVPPQGSATGRLGLLRAGAPRGTRQGVLVVAETTQDDLLRTTVQTAVVQIADDPARMPALRLPLALLAGMLLGGALGVEVWRHWGRRPA